MNEDQSEPPTLVPLEHDAAIGRVARSWGHLEHMVDLIVWDAARVPHQIGACITAQMGSVHPKLRALGALLVLWEIDPALIKKVDVFAANLHDLGEKRARAVHDARLTDYKGQVVRWQTTASSKGVIFGPQPETIEELKNLRTRIARNIRRFEDLKQEIRDAILTSEQKQPLRLVQIVEHPQTQDHTPNT